ncbi:hypothetical protein IJG26_00485 [Candidatus Saccharibacteria bacterium]|nr:hypothetical protein [Candidatus Saccharibacteria bacterium]
MRAKWQVIILGSLVGFTVLQGIILSSVRVLANDSSTDNANDVSPESCSMSASGMTSHSAEINGGSYQDNIGTTIVRIYCDDNEGFSVYAVGFTDDTYGKTVLSNSEIDSKFDIITGTATKAGSKDVSNWAMKLRTNSTTTYPVTIKNDFDEYHVIPNFYTKVLSRDNPTDTGTSATGAEFTTTYAAYISRNQISGTYTGQVKYTLVHPASGIPVKAYDTPAGFIGYYPNGGGADTMDNQGVQDSDTTATLWSSNFKRKGYGFAGWSTTYDYSDSNGFYGPNQDIDFEAGTYTGENQGLSLYAYWIQSTGTFQEWDECDDLNIGDIIALTDIRNNETYAVAKLSDGKCWMIENLRLGNDADITTENTNTDGSFGGVFTGLADPETENFSSSNASNSLYSTSNITGSYVEYRFPRYNDNNSRSGSVATEMNDPSDNIQSYGFYYTWAASIADTSYYSQNNSSVTSNSLCPTGWSLPVAGNDLNSNDNNYLALSISTIGEEPNDTWVSNRTRYYNKDDSTLGTIASQQMRTFPNNFVYSGKMSGSSNNGKGVNGYYWSSTSASSNYVYTFNISSKSVYPGTNLNTKNDGISIRCLKTQLGTHN